MCNDQNLIPFGMHDVKRISKVKLFCSKCHEIYNSKLISSGLDGAFFGSSFLQIFLHSFNIMTSVQSTTSSYQTYIPRIFGFRLCDNAVIDRETK